MLITPVTSLPAVGSDPGATKRVVLSTEKLRLTGTSTARGAANYRLIRRGEGGVWSETPHVMTLDGVGETGEVVVTEENENLVQGEMWAVLGDSGRSDTVYLSPVGAIIDSSGFYK